MADTLAEIVNTTVTAANLEDGEHTLLTTDANTAHVIKDVFVETSLTNLDLELNGFNVADVTKTNSGSLIVPPSSTLKATSTDFPLDYVDESYTYTIDGETDFVQTTDAFLGDTVSLTEDFSAGAKVQSTNQNDKHYKVGDYIYKATSDWNSVQRLYKVAVSNVGGTPTAVSAATGSYSGDWVFDGRYFIGLVAGSPEKIRRIDTQDNDSYTDVDLPTNFTLNSFPRSYYITGTNFIIFKSSGGGNPKLINYLNGTVIDVTTTSWSPSLDQNYWKLFASYDEEANRIYIGAFSGSSNSMYLNHFDDASTYLNGTGLQTVTATLTASGATFGTTYLQQESESINCTATRGKYFYMASANAPETEIIRFDLNAGAISEIVSSLEVYKTLSPGYADPGNVPLVAITFTTPTSATIASRSYDLSSYTADILAVGVTVS